MNTMAVPFGLLHGVLSFLNRRELAILSEENRRLDSIIGKHFATAPYFFATYLEYSDNRWKWFPDTNYYKMTIQQRESCVLQMSEAQISRLTSSKFLRFAVLYFNFDSDPMDVLKPINHLWEFGAVRIKSENITPLPVFAGLFTACRQLALEFGGALSLFSSLSHVKCRDMLIKDSVFDTANGLPMSDILEFLFKPINPAEIFRKANVLVTCTSPPKNDHTYNDLIQCVKKRFLDTPDPPFFYFVQVHIGDWQWTQAENFVVTHSNSNKKLCFNKRGHNSFDLLAELSDE